MLIRNRFPLFACSSVHLSIFILVSVLICSAVDVMGKNVEKVNGIKSDETLSRRNKVQ